MKRKSLLLWGRCPSANTGAEEVKKLMFSKEHSEKQTVITAITAPDKRELADVPNLAIKEKRSEAISPRSVLVIH